MKKILSLFLVVVMLAIPAFAATMTDVNEHVNQEAIEALIDCGIIDGYKQADGTYMFKPDKNITRAEVAKLMVCALTDELTPVVETSFTDVPATEWYAPYVEQAVKMGVVHGFGNGKFKPEANITFEQMCAIIENVLGYETTGDNYPKNVVLIAFTEGLANKTSTRGTDYITRGEVAQMIYNAFDCEYVEIVYGTIQKKGEKFGDRFTYDVKMITDDVATFGDIYKVYKDETKGVELLSERAKGIYYNGTLESYLAKETPTFIPCLVIGKDIISFEDVKNATIYVNGKVATRADLVNGEQLEVVYRDGKAESIVAWHITNTVLTFWGSKAPNADEILVYGDDFKPGESWLTYYGDFAVYVGGHTRIYEILRVVETDLEKKEAQVFVRAFDSMPGGYGIITLPIADADDEIALNDLGFIRVFYDYFERMMQWDFMPKPLV